MTTRKQRKQAALERVAAEKQARKDRKSELEALPADQRPAAEKADRAAAKQARKQAKAERKQQLAAMSKSERREAKRAEHVYEKVKHRPRRIVGWSVAAVLVVAIGVAAAPIVSDVARVTTLKTDSSTPEGVAARAAAQELAGDIADEGIVLLENDDVLPLAEQKLNVFGFESFNLRFGGGGSGGADQSAAVGLYDALAQEGIAHNQDLKAVAEEAGAKTASGSSNGLMQIVTGMFTEKEEIEPGSENLTDEVMTQARDFADTALIVVGNDGVEGSDQTPEQLRLTSGQRELLDTVTATFDDVIVVVNSGNQMELGFLDEYPQITGALWIGTPGPQGAVSLAQVLSGAVNPSGRLTDTYAYDVTSTPAAENFGHYAYSNAKRALVEYEEGIYVGYRYYETRYLDDEAAYQAAVQYPFGYGLSYTTFEQKASEPVVTDDQITIDVTVTNTGQVAGKEVVQAYFSAPYVDGGLEKSAIELGAYAKTGLLEPGASETVQLSFAVEDMASWDTSNGGRYVLDAGDYKLSVRSDVHTPIAEFTTHLDERIIDADTTTGTELENRFADASGDLTYLSRSDWEGTYPTDEDLNPTASEQVIAELDPTFEATEGQAPTYGADNGIQLADLVGKDYDDPAWEQFLDQFTQEEQVALFSHGAYKTEAVERLGVPSAILLDGPAGLNSLFSKVTAASYPTEVVIASTWNVDLAREMGVTVGTEANAYGVQGWYAPGMNLHRTAMGGRTFEYFSEDPLVSGTMAAAMVDGAQSKDVLTFMKHFVLNEQETNARTGVNVWLDEQAFRELYLTPFEITVKEGGANGAMSSFIHIGTSWSGGNEALLQDVLRDEWGFTGVVSTDAVLGGFMDPALSVRYGNDLMLAVMGSSTEKATAQALADDPVGVGNGLRDRVHTICYALLQTDLFK